MIYNETVKKAPKSYYVMENECNFLFKEAMEKFGPFWHIYTPGKETEILNTCDADYRFGVSNMAVSASESGIMIITNIQMENHMHTLGCGSRRQCDDYLKGYRYRYEKYLDRNDRWCNLAVLQNCEPILITDLEMFRKEVAYINRNGFVVDSRYLPFSYPWGGCNLYFNPFAQNVAGSVKYNNLPFKEKRLLCCRRVTDLPDSYMVQDGMILPASYVNYKFGESLFRDSHHYLAEVTRNVEAYSQAAKRLADTVVLDREEVFQAVKMLCVRNYNVSRPSLLAPKDKIEVAKIMHTDYHVTNAQIRMILKLTEEQVNSLFPPKAY